MKIPAISHLWGIKNLWQHKFVGGWFIHLSIDSYLKASLWSRIYFPSKSPIYLVLYPDKKWSPLEKLVKYWKKGLSSLGKTPTISHLYGIIFLWNHKIIGGWFTHFMIGSFLKKCLWSRKYWLAKITTKPVLHLKLA